MKDINKRELQVGDLVKKKGIVEYADGPREKVSKKTWVVIEQDGLKLMLGDDIQPLKETEEYLVVGSVKQGLEAPYKPLDKTLSISEGSTAENYRVLKDIKEKNWKKGEVVRIHGKVSFETLEKGYLEKVSSETEHQHLLVVVDPIKVGLVANKVKNG